MMWILEEELCRFFPGAGLCRSDGIEAGENLNEGSPLLPSRASDDDKHIEYMYFQHIDEAQTGDAVALVRPLSHPPPPFLTPLL